MTSRILIPLFLLSAPLIAAAQAPSASGSSGATAEGLKTGASDVFFQGHLLMLDAIKLEQKGDFAGSYWKFKDARAMFDSVHHSDPGWNPEIVEYRRKKTAEDMVRVQKAEIARRKAGGAPAESGVVGDPDKAKPGTQPAPSAPGAAPSLPGGTLPLSPLPNEAILSQPIPRGTSEVVREKLKAMQDRIDALQARNEQLNRELGGKENEMLSVRKQLLDSRDTEKKLQAALNDAQTKLETASAGEKRRNAELTKRVKELEGQLQTALTSLSSANERSEKMLGELQASNAQIRQLTEEKAALTKERDDMAALLADGNGGNGMDKGAVLKENQRLRAELATAQGKMSEMAKEKENDKKAITELREQVEAVEANRLALETRLADYKERITALVTRLEEAQSQLAETAEAGVMTEGTAIEENAVLKEIIVQQMKQQARAKRAHEQLMEELNKDGVLEKMKELGAETETVLKSIADMSTPLVLDQKQRGVLSKGVESALGTEGMIIMQDSVAANAGALPPGEVPPPQSTGATDKAGLTPELKAYADAAEQFFTENRFEEAGNQFRRILMIEPQNTYALCNMGVVQIRRGMYSDALQLVNKALAYEYNIDRAHYLKGVAYLRMGEVNEAIDAIRQGLKINPSNAGAHSTLGVIHLKRKEMDLARMEFEQAVQLDPGNGAAHYNLAVLCAMKQEFSKGLKHYRTAVANGVDPDRTLEEVLRQ